LKEKKEGRSYETDIGLNLDVTLSQQQQQQQVINKLKVLDGINLDTISSSELKEFEKLLPPRQIRPNKNQLHYSSNLNYHFICFDLETTSLGRSAEICQLAAIKEDGHCLSKYLVPKGEVSDSAQIVNNLHVVKENGRRLLYKNNTELPTVSLEVCLEELLHFIAPLDQALNPKPVTVLLGHNSELFDTPVLLRTAGKSFVDQLQDMNVYFADSRSIVRYLKKHPPPNVEMPSKENLSTLFNTLMNEEFDAHDALEDSKALCKLFLSRSSPLQLSRELLVNECNSISAEDAFRDIKLLDQSNDLVRSYQGNLYDHFNDQGPVKLGIIKKMTIQGISYQHLNRVYQQYGKRGLYAVLALPPSTSPTTSRPTARISKTSRIIASIIYHFETQ